MPEGYLNGHRNVALDVDLLPQLTDQVLFGVCDEGRDVEGSDARVTVVSQCNGLHLHLKIEPNARRVVDVWYNCCLRRERDVVWWAQARRCCQDSGGCEHVAIVD